MWTSALNIRKVSRIGHRLKDQLTRGNSLMMVAVTQATAQSNSRVNERCYRTVGLHRITVYNHVCFFFLFLPSALLLDGISKCLRSFMSFLRNILNDDVYGISASLFSSSEQSSYNAMFSLLHFVFWSITISFFVVFLYLYLLRMCYL